MQTLRGKTAVITGGGSGIGRGMAHAFAREGMNVVVSDVDLDSAQRVATDLQAGGTKAAAVRTDVSDIASVRSLARFAAEIFGHVHVLCNNAGVMVHRRGTEASHEDWLWVVGVNLWGVIHGMEAFLPAMRAHGEPAHIVNTASMNGIFPSAYSALYSTTKYGVLGLSETFANELRDTNVGISVLCPGGVPTEIFRAERNRPSDLRNENVEPTAGRMLEYDITPPMPAASVGDLVINGIRRQQLHIFTHQKIRRFIEERHRRMIDEFQVLAQWENTTQ